MPAKPACRAASQAALRLGQRAALVGLEQDRGAGAAYAPRRARGRRRRPGSRRRRPGSGRRTWRVNATKPCVVVLGQRILDRDDRIARRASRAAARSCRRVSSSLALAAPAGSGRRGRTPRRRRRARWPPARAGRKPARSIARASVASACLVGGERRPPAALVGDALAACPCSASRRAGGAVDLGGPVQRLRRSSPPPGRRPESPGCRARPRRHGRRRRRSGSRGSGSVQASRPAEIAPQRLARRPRPRRAPRPSTPRWSRCRRDATCSACRRARSAGASSAAWSAASRPMSAAGDLAVHVGRPRASRHSRRTRSPPSRRSTASPLPVEAPAGAMARPTAPPASGPRPRPSAGRGCPRPAGRAPSAIVVCASYGPAPPPRPRASSPSVSTGAASNARRDPPHPFLVGLRGDVLDRRLAVDAGEEQRRQQCRRARLQLRARGSQATPAR